MPWWPVTGVRLVVCKYTAGEASPKCPHSDRCQIWGSRLVSCTHTAAETWAAVVVFRLWWVKKKGGSWVELRWLVSANTVHVG